ILSFTLNKARTQLFLNEFIVAVKMTEINMRGIGAARWGQSIWRRETRPILRIPAGRASWLPRLVLLSLVLRLLMLSASSHAANPSDWWVHITNDRAEQIAQML